MGVARRLVRDGISVACVSDRIPRWSVDDTRLDKYIAEISAMTPRQLDDAFISVVIITERSEIMLLETLVTDDEPNEDQEAATLRSRSRILDVMTGDHSRPSIAASAPDSTRFDGPTFVMTNEVIDGKRYFVITDTRDGSEMGKWSTAEADSAWDALEGFKADPDNNARAMREMEVRFRDKLNTFIAAGHELADAWTNEIDENSIDLDECGHLFVMSFDEWVHEVDRIFTPTNRDLRTRDEV